MQFSQVVFKVSQLFEVRGHVSIRDSEDTSLRKVASYGRQYASYRIVLNQIKSYGQFPEANYFMNERSEHHQRGK